MEKLNRYLSLELLFALLFIIAFFLPWLDMGLIKIVGWDIPNIQKKMTKVVNFFSKNKDSVYTTYVLYLLPLLSLAVMTLWILLKQKASRIILMITGIFGLIISVNLFFKLPKIGSGVYLLVVASLLSVIYVVFVLFVKGKKEETQEPEEETIA